MDEENPADHESINPSEQTEPDETESQRDEGDDDTDTPSDETAEELKTEVAEHTETETEKETEEATADEDKIEELPDEEDQPEEPSERVDEEQTSTATQHVEIVQAVDLASHKQMLLASGSDESVSEERAGNTADKPYNPLDELTDQELVQLIDELSTENRHLGLENKLFEYFLLDYDPSALEGMEELLEYVLNPDRANQRRRSSDSRGRQSSLFAPLRKFRLDSFMSLSSIAEGKGPKVNLMQKSEMIQKATDEIQANLRKFQIKSHVVLRNLKCELEEFSIGEAEIKESIELFEYQVVTQGLDTLTQRIPAEKFVRYMDEWLKSANLQIEKLRLRLATMRLQYKKVSQTLIQRQELGENVHAVDFDQLEIENKHLLQKIEQKNVHLIELKKINGSANLVLCSHKNYLQKQQDECNSLKEEIKEKEMIIEDTGEEVDTAAAELEAAEDRYYYYKKIQTKYTVPDVMEYIKLKGRLYDLRKNIKVWSRRKKIQEIAFGACLRDLRRVIGSAEVDSSWFDTKSESSDSSATFVEFHEE